MSLLAVAFAGDGYRATLGDEWLQGRTAYGGASAATALMAVKAAYPDLPPLRSVQIAFVGPLAGDVRISPTLLRRGKNSAFVGCDVVGSDGVGLRALFLFMASRDSAISYAGLDVPPHDPPEANPVDPDTLPQGFLRNFDLASGAKREAGFLRWTRLRERAGMDAETEFLTIADALPPAAMQLAKTWGPISSATWQINLVTDAPRTRDGWWLLCADTLHAGHGNSSQSMTIWNRDGDAIATATQSVALFV
ncbi:MAG: thioesterase family protein [Sphingomonadales bacterium]